MANSVPKNETNRRETITSAGPKIDMLLRQRESNISFTKRSLDASAQASGGDKQKNRDERTIVWEADGNRENEHEEEGIGELANEEKLQLALWCHDLTRRSSATAGGTGLCCGV